MNEYGELLDNETVRFERLLPGPIERVWAYLTESDKRAQWLAAGETELKTDGKVEMHFHNMSLSGATDIPRPDKYKDMPERMSFGGKVLRCEPLRLLSYTWELEDERSEVTYELSEQCDKVLLVLTHRRLTTDDMVLSVATGWHTHLGLLEDILNGAGLRPFYKTQSELEAIYEQRLA
jgi:uncharacterized protein YndB with AHSA1/START domain